MKNQVLLLKLSICCFFCIHVSASFSQTANTKWMINPYDERVFIENKGQYALLESELGCKILFSFEQGNTTFFLCKDQFIVREVRDVEANSHSEEIEKDDPATEHFPAPTFSYLKFSFDNTNPVVELPTEQKRHKALHACAITGVERSPATQKYYLPDASLKESPRIGKNRMITASAFSTVIYWNFYEGIDLVFSAHEKNGLKYLYVVHPFADASLIHITYSGVGTISLDTAGNIHAGIPGTEVLDHAPKVFHIEKCITGMVQNESSIIPCSYSLEKNSYSILTDNYDHSQTIVIDPWVTNPNFVNQNKAFDIAGDAAGNAYVFGGHFPWQVKKFSPNGNPVWTFNTSYTEWYGALAVDPSGNSIITEGCCGGRMMKLDSAGNVLWSLTNSVDEYWRLAYDCDFSKLYLATGYASSAGLQYESVSLLDTATGAFSNSTALFGQFAEPRSLAVGLDGNVYVISCGGGFGGDHVLAMTPSFTTIFSVSSGYNLLYNGPLYANGANTTSGQNGISAGNNFLCTSNGATLYKRDKNNGALISSLAIPGGSVENISGILVDSCDNIFVGSSNAVIKYDSSLNLLSSTATTGAVYCLSPGLNGELLVCGNGFIASMDLSVCRDIFCNSGPTNQGGNMFSASDTDLCEKFCIDFFDSSSNNPTSWQWSFPGGSPSSSTDQNPAFICYDLPGIYDVTLITTNANGSETLTLPDYITVYATPPFPTITQVGYTLTSSPSTFYQWQLNAVDIPGATNQSYTIAQSGFYTVIVSDANGCQNSVSLTVTISGIKDVLGDQSISIYPNPSAGSIIIEWLYGFGAGEVSIDVINILGQNIYSSLESRSAGTSAHWSSGVSPEKKEIDLSGIESGIYFIEIKAQENFVRKKIIVAK